MFSRYIAKNILLGVKDLNVFSMIKQNKMQSPPLRKVLGDRIIHLSYIMPITHGAPVFMDFGAACLVDPGQKHTSDVMPGV